MGWQDAVVMTGLVAVLRPFGDNAYEVDKILVTTTVRTKDKEFLLAMATRPTTEEIKTIEIELKTEQALPKVEASAKVETANPAEEAERLLTSKWRPSSRSRAASGDDHLRSRWLPLKFHRPLRQRRRVK